MWFVRVDCEPRGDVRRQLLMLSFFGWQLNVENRAMDREVLRAKRNRLVPLKTIAALLSEE
jgi:hypothetical protein